MCFAVLAMTSAEEMKSEEPKQVLATLPYYNFGLNYAHAVHPYHYTYQVIKLIPKDRTLQFHKFFSLSQPTVQYQPIQYKYVPKEYEVEVKSYQPALPEEACLNVFGVRVPCHKAKRSADEEQETEVAQPVKIETPYYYAHPNYYAHQIATPLTYAHTYHPYHYNYYHHAVSPI